MLRCVSMLVLVAVLAPASFAARPATSLAASAGATTERSLASTNDCWQDQVDTIYVPETGHHIHEPFLSSWRQYDLAILGYPISEPLELDGMTVQYFERARFEHHPELAGTAYEVLFTLLGSWAAGAHADPAFDPLPLDTPQPDPATRYYTETGHYLGTPFIDFWGENGGLPVFGYPISEPMYADGRLVQYFERARFEHHPERAGTPYEVQLGHLGRERAAADGIDQQAVPKLATAVDYTWAPEPRSYRIPVLMYHHFGYPTSRFQVSYQAFEQQLGWLRDQGYTPVTMMEAYAGIFGGGSLPERPAIITFDDGQQSQWAAAEILDRFGYKGVFFVHPDGPLSPDQLRDLAARGHELGSHTHTHPFLTRVSDERLRDEVHGSRMALAGIVGQPVNFFAYPNGDWNSRVLAAVQAAGYCGAVHAWDGQDWTPEKRWIEPRIEISGHLSLAQFAALIGSR